MWGTHSDAAARRGLGKLCCRTWRFVPAPFLGAGVAPWGRPPVLCSSKLSPCCVRAHCHADQGPWECVLSPHSPTPCSPRFLLPTAPRPGRCLSTQPLCPVRLAGLESGAQAVRTRHEAPGTLRRAWFCQGSSEINPHGFLVDAGGRGQETRGFHPRPLPPGRGSWGSRRVTRAPGPQRSGKVGKSWAFQVLKHFRI